MDEHKRTVLGAPQLRVTPLCLAITAALIGLTVAGIGAVVAAILRMEVFTFGFGIALIVIGFLIMIGSIIFIVIIQNTQVGQRFRNMRIERARQYEAYVRSPANQPHDILAESNVSSSANNSFQQQPNPSAPPLPQQRNPNDAPPTYDMATAEQQQLQHQQQQQQQRFVAHQPPSQPMPFRGPAPIQRPQAAAQPMPAQVRPPVAATAYPPTQGQVMMRPSNPNAASAAQNNRMSYNTAYRQAYAPQAPVAAPQPSANPNAYGGMNQTSV